MTEEEKQALLLKAKQMAYLKGGVAPENWERWIKAGGTSPSGENSLKATDLYDTENNLIYLYGPLVDEGTRAFFEEWGEPAWSALWFKERLEEMSGSKIEIRINSPGGSVPEISSIVLSMQESNKEFLCVNEGKAFSAASVVLCMGDERKLAELSETMIHNARSIVIGDKNELKAAADRLSDLDEQVLKLYADQLEKDEKEIKLMMDAETFMSAQKASECGFGEIYKPANKENDPEDSNDGEDADAALFNVAAESLLTFDLPL